ncbi:TPA: hypothetical protein DDW69_00755 [candidate division CPR2 bacterium]|uniref:YbbR family protein n=1 Tax=candidate division CPR2 bacterium GW2011_GWC1_41_48 TaxID=1618344 RepID=A0A0G0W798_UNCC2|nr:MAG: YbbR-like protein [candidate division CPR2 bacterium GW2011_GWC2_39_35]KKR27183.1 MAG: YbbR-like protein [candidate division CPR2 bacterium GW2011_GWD2_39_7]KKR29194.1 MAG: YbbR-like protein [candidate division CPR2 bacterium GW2011_GWD1_39_7]KKS08869.1 MAG: YbbR family protein [candidate division CPR2 bacterium GW2011_GWC1_41_48]OGB70332.1 MAG: hypothetical protein A2Y26_01135 [candidate division CPR2 bacterium GWD2_39_7]HBG81354.1 hypothetical protein [candidate division CPR2 bacteri
MKYITNNFFAKFMSLVLAFCFWIFVTAVDMRLGFFPKDVSVDVKNIQTGLAVAEDPGNVKIKIKAPMSVYSKLNSDNFDVFVDASAIKSGGAEHVDIKVISKDPSVQILGTEPQNVLLKLEDEETKKIPIVLKTKGDPSGDYRSGEGEVKTKDVEVLGAPSKIKQINEVAAFVELKGNEKGNIDGEVPVIAFDETDNPIRFLKFNPEKTPVYLPILPKVESKTVGIKVKLKGETAKGYWVNKVRIDPPIVAIKGELEKIKNIEFVETAEIDLANSNKNIMDRVKLTLPDKVTLVENLDKVSVQIFVADLDSAKTVTPSINFKKANPKLKAEILTMTAVTLTGSQASLTPITSENVILNIDLSSYQVAGEHKIQVSKDMVIKPGDVEVSKVLPEIITVKLTEIQETLAQ